MLKRTKLQKKQVRNILKIFVRMILIKTRKRSNQKIHKNVIQDLKHVVFPVQRTERKRRDKKSTSKVLKLIFNRLYRFQKKD